MSQTLIPSYRSWTKPLTLVWQPIWTPTQERRGEILTRVHPPQTEWLLSPLKWWQMAATLDPYVVAALDQWVWMRVHVQTPAQWHWHINIWPQTVLVASQWIADQDPHAIALEMTEQWPWSPDLWRLFTDVWMARGGRVWVDDWTDPMALPPWSHLTGVKVDRTVWDVPRFTPAYLAQWTQFVTRCHDQGLQVVAEGIETVHQQEAALACGCDGLQGFLWGQPQPWPELESSLDFETSPIRSKH